MSQKRQAMYYKNNFIIAIIYSYNQLKRFSLWLGVSICTLSYVIPWNEQNPTSSTFIIQLLTHFSLSGSISTRMLMNIQMKDKQWMKWVKSEVVLEIFYNRNENRTYKQTPELLSWLACLIM